MIYKVENRFKRFVYWLNGSDFLLMKSRLKDMGIELKEAKKAACESLRASYKKVYVTPPWIWERKCVRQSSWYRVSKKAGMYMVVSSEELPIEFKKFLEAVITESEFHPNTLPTQEGLRELVNSPCYQENRPDEWERVSLYEKVLFKVLFTITGFWKWGESCKKYWLTHRANHANFLCKRYTVNINGEEVPYSISENAGICSACLELFNIIGEDNRKLVRACPGAIIAGGLKRWVYYDVKPLKKGDIND
ncbi:MAG: hypothetical protein D6828_06015 [Nitrospirae bacterium]|nr:MAG: hypothetical protein D6828_06015 [Nitrospirota bacterium]